MQYGLMIAASGVQVNMYRQDVFANNLANVKTPGFKADLASIRQRDAEAIEDGLSFDRRKPILDMLGGGVFAEPTRIRFDVGPIEKTGNDTDLALTDENTFFVVQLPNGEKRLTRDGRFAVDRQGFLIQATNGNRVLNEDDDPIQVGEGGRISFDRVGAVQVEGEEVDRIGLADVVDKTQLFKEEHGLIRMGSEAARQPAAVRDVQPGYLEGSSINPIQELNRVISSGKAVSANANMIRYFDTTMEQSINRLGRVQA